MKIDVRSKKTEAQWLQVWDRFFLAATPKFFEWLGWSTLLAAVAVVQEASGSVALAIIEAVCVASLWFYFAAYFARVEFAGFLQGNPNIGRFVAIVISTAMASAAYWLSRLAVSAFSIGIGA